MSVSVPRAQAGRDGEAQRRPELQRPSGHHSGVERVHVPSCGCFACAEKLTCDMFLESGALGARHCSQARSIPKGRTNDSRHRTRPQLELLMRYQGCKSLQPTRRMRPARAGRWLCLMACVLVLSLRVSGAGAQAEQETALARALFEEGVSAADEGRWAEAADRIGRAHSLKPTPATAFHWASALIELGQLVQAGERLRAIASEETITDELRAESRGGVNHDGGGDAGSGTTGGLIELGAHSRRAVEAMC